MPYKQVFVSAPKDPDLTVFENIPDGYVESRWMFMSGIRTAKDKNGDYLYFCHWCKGWIGGEPNTFHEDTIAILSGRRGEVSYCRRCGQEISFVGIVS